MFNPGLSAVALLVIALGAAWGSPVLLVRLVEEFGVQGFFMWVIGTGALVLPRSGMSCFIAIFCSTWGIGYWVVVVEVGSLCGSKRRRS